ncbi:MAG: hypothetical protein Ct9H300mP23_09740 [Nitrospinota bacterium]|nr:MAG: hypothetical protein Ct9H300mP23_09740 [Nitrospinota bacterium]
MKDGSVIVDLAAEQGGNCKLSEAGKIVKVHGVSIIGYTDFRAAWLHRPVNLRDQFAPSFDRYV